MRLAIWIAAPIIAQSIRVSYIPEEWKPFTELNAEMALECEVITEKKDSLVDEYILCHGH